MKKNKKLISIVVLVAIIVGCFPFSVFASDTQPTEELSVADEPKITEDIERREESIKHFLMPDGSYNAISYSRAVHRINEKGEWIDIDNSLSLSRSGKNEIYSTKDNRLSFPKSYNYEGDMISLKENGYTISMSLIQEDKQRSSSPSETSVSSTKYKRAESFDTLEEAIKIDNRSSVSYSNILPNTDIEYVMNGNDIKENIIVKSRSDSYIYRFEITLEGLVAVLQESGAILINDSETKETKYVIPAPYMYDAKDEYSEDVKYSLISGSKGKYILTVTADPKWINDDSRAFPVTVDPSVMNSGWISDTFVNLSKTSTNYGTALKLRVGSTFTTLIDMRLPSLDTDGAGGVFNSAYLYVDYYGDSYYGSTIVGLYAMSDYWRENTVTYDNMPDIATPRITTTKMTTTSDLHSGRTKTANFNVTAVVKEFYNSFGDFCGVALKYESGVGNIVMNSSEKSSGSTPYMTVNYTAIPSGEYYLQNKATNTFLQIDDATAPNYTDENAIIELKSLAGDAGNYQKWRLTHIQNGVFSIISVQSGKALSIMANQIDLSGVNIVQQEYTGTSRQRWKITKSSSGNYIIKPEYAKTSSPDLCMCVAFADENSSECVARQLDYISNDGYYDDEWILAKIGYISETATLEGQQTESWCWAATARMFAKHYGTVSEQRNQENLLAYMYPNVSAEDRQGIGGNVSKVQTAINYYLNTTCETVAKEHKVYNEETLLLFFSDTSNASEGGNVVYVEISEYDTDGIFKKRHAVMIYGYIIINGQNYFLIRDSLPINSGKTYMMTYSSLYYKQAQDDDGNTVIHVWENTVVRKTAYSDNTSPYYYDQVG